MDESTLDHKASEAASKLAAEGLAVTARAVRSRAGVSMASAAAAAKAWNEAQAQIDAAPEMPASVATRAAGLWAEAVREARAAFDHDREAWDAQRRLDAQERNELEAAVSNVEDERDRLFGQLGVLTAERDALVAQAAADGKAAAKAEGRAEQAEKAQERAEAMARAARDEADELREKLAALAREANDEPKKH